MHDFKYQCVNRKGATVTGKINSANIEEATSKLKSQGLIVLKVDKSSSINIGGDFFKPKVTLGDLSLLCRQMSSLLSAGIPLTRSITSLSKQTVNPTLKETMIGISKMIEEGATFTEALKKYPKIFPELLIAMVEAGEISGNIDDALNKIALQLHKEKTITDTINSAFIYPKVLIGFAALIFVAILVFIVPVFKEFLPPTDNTPLVTRIVFDLSGNIISYWYLWLVGLAIVIFAIKSIFKISGFIRFWDNFKIKMPLLGELFYKTVVARFIRCLASLLESGIPLLQCLEYAGPVSGNRKFTEAAKYISQRVQEGKSLTEPFEEVGLFQPMVINMVAAGEEAGSISKMLACLADYYEEEVTILTKGIFALLEPLLIISVAISIGGLLMALYMPIFSVITGAK